MRLRISALTLKGAKATQTWDPEAKAVDDYQGGHKLIIKQALVGPEAADGEVNVLQVGTRLYRRFGIHLFSVFIG